MSNILCHLCGGLVDRIGLQPTGVRLCGCVAKFKARKARIALLEAVAREAVAEWQEVIRNDFDSVTGENTNEVTEKLARLVNEK